MDERTARLGGTTRQSEQYAREEKQVERRRKEQAHWQPRADRRIGTCRAQYEERKRTKNRMRRTAVLLDEAHIARETRTAKTPARKHGMAQEAGASIGMNRPNPALAAGNQTLKAGQWFTAFLDATGA